MRTLRGRERDPAADRERTRELLSWTAETREPAVRVWRPPRQLAFGRRDAVEPGYDRARRVALGRGFRPTERLVGGRAVAHTGSTVAFARTAPVEDVRVGIEERYEAVIATVERALGELGAPVRRGEPEGAFCPGANSLSSGGKVAGVAQRVRGDAALVSGAVIVRDAGRIAEALAPVYAALDAPFDPESVGSVADAGGPDDPERVMGAIEAHLVGDGEPEVEDVGVAA